MAVDCHDVVALVAVQSVEVAIVAGSSSRSELPLYELYPNCPIVMAAAVA